MQGKPQGGGTGKNVENHVRVYAQTIVVQKIFGHTLEFLRGIKYLFKYGITHCFQSTSIYLSLFICLHVVLIDKWFLFVARIMYFITPFLCLLVWQLYVTCHLNVSNINTLQGRIIGTYVW